MNRNRVGDLQQGLDDAFRNREFQEIMQNPTIRCCLTLRFFGLAISGAALLLAFSGIIRAQQSMSLPHLARNHGATQIIVDGKPFLVRGGELENSSASSLSYMETVWPKIVAMHCNTVLAPAYWRLIEPQQGKFDFTSVDGLIQGARQHHMRLVLLWFGSWKNSMSSYVPDWVKQDQTHFPRAARADRTSLEILSALSPNNLAADASAFVALMRHLRKTDSTDHTVILVQVENEVGMIPDPRDHSAAANAAFLSPVPAELTAYLSKNRDSLEPSLKQAWEAHGAKVGANWPDTFGTGPATDELFTAWTEAHYTGEVAARGKGAYPLPMYVNAALIRPGKLPGQYPSGGPLPHLFDVWRAAAPAIDFFAPDLYFPNVVEWANRYSQPHNPLFIPESGRASAADLGANALYAYGQLNAMGYSVYAPEFLQPEEQQALGRAYRIIDQLTPLILASQGTGRMIGIRAPADFAGTVDLAQQQFTLGGYTFFVHFREPASISMGAKVEPEIPGVHGGLILQLGPDDFLVAGTGMVITFMTHGEPGTLAGIDSIWEGNFVDGAWRPGRELNGDDDNQGRYLRMPAGEFTMRRARLYHYH